MASLGRGIVLRQVDRLFRDGTLTGLGDGQLLERYLTDRDEEAFEALVDQHGPMVLGLCRRILRDPRDIEDAFQATFLVLVQKAPGIRDGNLLSKWLYGVAYRVARRARSRTLRRRDRETAVGEPEAASSEPDLPERNECEAMLDRELSRLPEKYRAPLVLCYLRGRTHDQAAEELRCPVGTVRSRLARGRDLLRDRLTRRGIAPGAMASMLGNDATFPARLLVAVVPPPLAIATVRAAIGFGSSSLLKTGASSLALAQGVLTTMKFQQIQWMVLAGLATCLSAGSVVAVSLSTLPPQQAPPAANVEPRPVAVGADDARIKALEAKIDQLERRLGEKSPTPPPSEAPPVSGVRPQPVRASGEGVVPPSGPVMGQSKGSIPVGELETELRLALEEFRRAARLFGNAALDSATMEHARGKALIVAARVEALDEEYRDEKDRLLLERQRKAAQCEKATALEAISSVQLANTKRLSERRPLPVVSTDELAISESKLKAASADRKTAQVDLDEVELRIRQLDRRGKRVRAIVAFAEQVKKEATAPLPGGPSSPEVPSPPRR